MLNNIKLKFDDDFFLPEERCGWQISVETKKLWAVELDLLNEFLRVCRENNIEVYAFAGTLLGAVRHQGFIPWDDDVDVCMTRENYNKLERIAGEAFQYPYFFQTARSDQKFFTTTPRLRNSESTGIIPWKYSPDYNGGIFIDCHVMDSIPKSEKRYKIQRRLLLILQELLRAYKPDTSTGQLVANRRHTFVKGITKHILNYNVLLNIYDKVSSIYNGKSDLLALTSTALFSDKYRCYFEDLTGDETLVFECLDIPIPRNSHRILSEIYGDYMEYPPVEEIIRYHKSRIIIDTEISYKGFFKDNTENKLWDEEKHKVIISHNT